MAKFIHAFEAGHSPNTFQEDSIRHQPPTLLHMLKPLNLLFVLHRSPPDPELALSIQGTRSVGAPALKINDDDIAIFYGA